MELYVGGVSHSYISAVVTIQWSLSTRDKLGSLSLGERSSSSQRWKMYYRYEVVVNLSFVQRFHCISFPG